MSAFWKVEGLGNDFILLDRRDRSAAAIADEVGALRQAAPQVCDRRRGIGGDGILLVGPSHTEGAAASMLVVNHDGSRPEMCGNGLRCVALFVSVTDDSPEPIIDTDDGPKPCAVKLGASTSLAAGLTADVRVDMGPARHGASQTPAAGDGRAFASVSMGNPHAIAFVGADEDPRALATTLGPGVEVDPTYPEGTNVELARVHDGGIRLWVWERGCGLTDACGTGACATAAAAAAAGLVPAGRAVAVHLPGGTLQITVPEDPARGVLMEGPARVVFAGTMPPRPA